MLVICIVACMSTGCSHEHKHDDKSKTEKSGHTYDKNGKGRENHRH